VRQSATGGAFGGKEDYPSMLGCYAALLANKSGKEVRIVFDRTEDLLVSPKRHPSKSHYRMGLTKDGKITALEVEMFLDSGAYTTLSRVVLQRTHLHTAGAYFVPNIKVHSRAMATNTPPTGAFRGFGAPQSIFAIERHMDLAAKKLGMNPLDLRLKNTLKTGDIFPYGQVFKEANNADAVLRKAAELSDYYRKHEEYARQPHARVRKGIGIAVALHGGGFTGAGEDRMGSTAKVSFDGEKFNIYTSITEMGQGVSMVFPMVAAEALGVPIEKVEYIVPDTSKTPNTGPTVASRSTMYAGKAVQDAAETLKKDILAWAQANGKKGGLEELAQACLKDRGTLEAIGMNIFSGGPAWDEEKFQGDAYRGYAWIANAVEVEVDMDTYEANAIHVGAAAEVGRAVNPMQATGQLSGGILQGIGWAHIEDMRVDDKGVYTSKHMNSYLVPTTLDTPSWDIALLEDPCPEGCYGAKGIGELPANGGAPAFIAAVENATGVFGTEIPLTGEKLFELLEEKNGGGK
ncbi:molybdopterin-dependent oxidoreductase, partial [Synergistaceae bacterium OttesenSCG-928-D05]|nr:molybdopterin-dependent oxidoreductase [Synergistaceae bacterium OttesenSCG-928-D05]